MPAKERGKGTKEEGTVYVSSTGNYYEAPEIDADKLRDFKDNIYGRGLSNKLKNLIFGDKFTIEVKDAKGETDEDLQKTMTQMCEHKSVRLWANMQRAYMDIFWYGIALFNPVWGYENNEYKLLKLRHLPAYTFRNASVNGTTKIYSQILQGISLDEDKNEIEFHQTDENGSTQQLKNVFYVKDPTAEGLAGESIAVPLIADIEMLKYAWDMQMKQVHRTGAKILFIKVTNPQAASNKNGGVGDIEYANNLLQKWSSDMAYQLRENMELIDPGIKDDSNNLEVIAILHKMAIDYVSPTSFIEREGGIGGSEAERGKLLNRFIRGIHSSLAEDPFEMLLNRYLEYNEYKDYTVSIHIPSPSIDRSEIELKQAVEGFKSKSLTINEIRKRLGADGLDEKDIEELLKLYERLSPPKVGGIGMMEAIGAAEIMEALGHKNPLFAKVKIETPKKVEKSIEEELKEAADKLSDSVIKALENEE